VVLKYNSHLLNAHPCAKEMCAMKNKRKIGGGKEKYGSVQIYSR
jgi:hypothetical protein